MNAWQILSALLQYPDRELLDAGDELAQAARELPPSPQRDAILAFLPHRRDSDELAAQREYVATFDFSARCTLHLSFYAYGDRRQRGIAMLALKQRFAAAGWPLNDGELPDHLAVLLEFAGLADDGEGTAVLSELRPALELVRSALHEQRSPYAELLDAVCLGLEPLTDEEAAAVRALALAGPPGETVGLEPFGPPETMPEPFTAPARIPSPLCTGAAR